MARALARAAQATFIGYGAIDGVERIRSALVVPGFPLVVIVGLGMYDVLAGLDDELHRRLLMAAALTCDRHIRRAPPPRSHPSPPPRERSGGAGGVVVDRARGHAVGDRGEGRKRPYLLINGAMERQFGRRRSEIIGSRIEDLMSARNAHQIQEWDAAARRAPNQLISGKTPADRRWQSYYYINQRQSCEVRRPRVHDFRKSRMALSGVLSSWSYWRRTRI